MKQILTVLLVCVVLIGCAIDLCSAAGMRQAKLETSVGTFIIEGKVVKGSNGIISGYFPEYNIIVKKGDNKIDFMLMEHIFRG